MSQYDGGEGQGSRTARERLRVEREQERQSAKRLRTLKMAGVTIFVLGVATLVGISTVVLGKGGSETTDTKPVVDGPDSAPATLTVYEDFRCPACGQFESQFRDTINSLRKEGKLRTEYHLVTLIDDNGAGHGSANAANAALCAEDEHKFAAYHDVLYKNQPPEEEDKFRDTDHLLRLAKKVPGLSQSVPFEECVEKGKSSGRVERSNQAFKHSDHQQTPTVLLDGEDVYGKGGTPLTPKRLRQMVEDKA